MKINDEFRDVGDSARNTVCGRQDRYGSSQTRGNQGDIRRGNLTGVSDVRDAIRKHTYHS